jgi:NAD(P)-dependent dehydrogenase (short-subunit alcohol dehydrogenase family)
MTVVVIGGTAGLGLELVRHYAAQGRQVVLTGRDPERAAAVAAEVGPNVSGAAVDLGHPEGIADGLKDVGPVEHLVLSAIDRDQNTASDYDLKRALYLVTLKLVGYTEVIHVLRQRLAPSGSILLFGGRAKDRPYPGSTTVSTVNGGVVGMVNALATELAPIRVNAIHPRHRRRQPLLGRPTAGGAGRGPRPHAHWADGHHGRRRRRGCVPVGEWLRQRGEPLRGRRLAPDVRVTGRTDSE